MALGVALALAAAVVAWGGRGESVRNREAADSALEQVGNLTSRVEALENELRASTTALSRAERVERSLADRLDRVTARLDKALGRVRKSTAAARAGAKSAAADSASALATAQDAARELNVLQERYDYPLRRYHGGG
jgi:chromosome segregation ATPase